MKKIVIQLNIHSDKEKKKAMKAVTSIQGIDSISMDMEGKKMTVIGDVDPVHVICNLRKLWCPEILTVGPAKDEKKDEAEKKKKEDEVKSKCGCDTYHACNCYMPPPQNPCYNSEMKYVVHCAEEYPSLCVIN